jgi:hypothetical protein
VKRLGAILDKTIHNNPQFSEQIKIDLLSLRNEISDEKGVVPTRTIQYITNEPECVEWIQFEKDFQIATKTWLEIPWFFVENYFYRIILDITGYFNPNNTEYGVDPFESQKRESLLNPIHSGSVKATSESVLSFYKKKDDTLLKDFLGLMLVSDLWGNQADLSFSGGASVKSIEKEAKELREHVIANDEEKILSFLLQNKGRYAMIVDNCGQEFVSDLFFAEVLTHVGIAEHVTFYVKSQPVFVSDVMEKDVKYTLQVMKEQDSATKHFGELFESYFNRGVWEIQSDRFFTSPVPFWELPQRLIYSLSKQTLVFIKGDANYRRLINDALWSLDTQFSNVVEYFPSRVVALRTLKSDSLVGMLDGTAERKRVVDELNRIDPEWRVNGKYGIIQLK